MAEFGMAFVDDGNGQEENHSVLLCMKQCFSDFFEDIFPTS
jgi:hypothetical protein